MSSKEKSNDISRRAFLVATAMAAPVAATALTPSGAPAATAAAPAVHKSRRRRNVLFITTDDMCARLGCYGVPVKSPNLDHLARSGVLFEHHYCQFPLCGPSRTSLMTGMAPDTTRCYDLNTDFRNTIPQTVTLPQLFQKNSYFVSRAGKIYHYNNPSEIGTPGFDDPASWLQVSYPAGYDRTHDEGLVDFYVPQKRLLEQFRVHYPWRPAASLAGPVEYPTGITPVRWLHGGKGPDGIRISQDGCTPILPLSKNGDLGISIAGHPSDGKDEIITDSMVAEAAICMMEEHRRDPWFIACGFFRPHVPFIVPSKYFDMYPVDEIAVPPFHPSELETAPPIAYTTMDPNYGMTLQTHKEAVRGYYAAISFVDAQVGRLVAALNRLGLAEDTVIVFWSDHGFMVGEHGQWEKMKLFEASTRVPFIVAGAGVTAAGRTCRRTNEHLDVYPTLAELCELDGTPENLQGRSLVPLLRNPDMPWDHPAVTQVTRPSGTGLTMGYSIRTERYRYTMWSGGTAGEELYDYQLDPRELRNLAKAAPQATLKEKLRATLVAIASARGMRHST